MVRQLVTIQRITKIESIEGADKIVKAQILGWQCVVGKDDFKEGDLCIYCEIDSLFPVTPEFDFLSKCHHRIKTIRLKGVISQGLCLSLKYLEGKKFSSDTRENPTYNFKEGDDVTNLLGVTKWEPPELDRLMGEAKSLFPSFIPKTDETRVMLLQSLLDKYKGTLCYVSEKIDGSSLSVYLNDCQKCSGLGSMTNESETDVLICDNCKGTGKVYGVCSRNLELKQEGRNLLDNIFIKASIELGMEEKLRKLNKNIALQGELAGVGIQNNRLDLKTKNVYFFNAYDIDEKKYLNYEDFKNLITSLDLNTVPIIDENFILNNDINGLVKYSTDNSILNKDRLREGVVIRPLVEMKEEHVCKGELPSNRVSFKVVSPEYLLEHGL